MSLSMTTENLYSHEGHEMWLKAERNVVTVIKLHPKGQD